MRCPECGAEFVARAAGKPQKFCSRACRLKSYYRHPADTKNTPKDAICGLCREPFVKLKRNQRYCSRECYKKAWPILNRARYNERAKAYRWANIEKRRNQERDYYRANREKINFEKLKSQRRNKPKLLSIRPWKYLLISRKSDARIRGMVFELTDEWAAARWTGTCELTGIEFRNSGKQGPHPFSPSIDKIKPEKGYTKDNSRFVLLACNTFKGRGTDADMYEIAAALMKNMPPQENAPTSIPLAPIPPKRIFRKDS